ncbi:MAG TPA: hypothetical protein VHD76_17990 [Bryobacteraceae bacterium]|jgi:hypothetical protein|nr:hypothetical protein [Bryobacteraceae bacterium]
MALTKEELIASLQNEVRILVHLASKVDADMLDYRPSAKQRSTIELLRYLTYMGPELIHGIKGGAFDIASWTAASQNAENADFAQTKAALAAQGARYAEALGGFSEEDLAAPIEMFGQKSSKGSVIVNMVLCGHAAYRTQLFLYLKANGHTELNTLNLWGGVDG